MMTPDERLELISYAKKNMDLGAYQSLESQSTFNQSLLDKLFPYQLEILNDPSKKKALVAGRRFGKSYLLIVMLLVKALESKNNNVLFVAMTRESAKKIVWNSLIRLCKDHSISVELNSTDLLATFSNGSTIQCKGCDNASETEKLRGFHFDLIAIDEGGAFGSYLRYFVEEVLLPELEDYNGSMIIAGTPNITSTGYFHDITTSSSSPFKVFKGTVLDNPRFPRWAGKDNWKQLSFDWWKAYLKENNLTEDMPLVQREWFARWVRSDESIVYHLTEDNIYDELPDQEDMIYIAGLDFGVVDANAFVVGAYSPNNPNLYITDIFTKSGMSYTETCNKILDLYWKYDITYLAADPGAGKIFINDLSNQHNLPINVAEKRNRLLSIERVAQDFKTGNIKIHRSLTSSIDDLKALVWTNKSKGITSASDHISDALRYMYAESNHYQPRTKPEDIVIATPEELMKQKRIDKLKKQQARQHMMGL